MSDITKIYFIQRLLFYPGAFQIVALRLLLWAVGTPPTADCLGWCSHQPATI